jgi:hypothetical protein
VYFSSMIADVRAQVILAYFLTRLCTAWAKSVRAPWHLCTQSRYLRRRAREDLGQGVGAVTGSGSPKNPADV